MDKFLPLKRESVPPQNDAVSHQFSNLNLNQNHKCLNQSFVHSNSKTFINNKSFDSKIGESKNEKGSLNLWNKPSSNKAFKSFSEFDEVEKDDAQKRWKNESSSKNKINSSTLSLHIAAYENFIEGRDTVTWGEKEGLKKKEKSSGLIADNKEVLSTLVNQNPFEFPRQQTDDVSKPEVMQFKASQQLLNPNESDSSNNGQKDSGYQLKLYEPVTYNTQFLTKLMLPRFVADPRQKGIASKYLKQFGPFEEETKKILAATTSVSPSLPLPPPPVPPPSLPLVEASMEESMEPSMEVPPVDPLSSANSSKPLSLLEMPPVEWPEQFPILGSALDDPVSFAQSAPTTKKSLLGPGERKNKNIVNFDVNDPHFQSLVKKQIEMANELSKSSTEKKQEESKTGDITSKKKASRWDPPVSSNDRFKKDSSLFYFAETPFARPLQPQQPPPSSKGLWNELDNVKSPIPSFFGNDNFSGAFPNPGGFGHRRRERDIYREPYDDDIFRRGSFNESLRGKRGKPKHANYNYFDKSAPSSSSSPYPVRGFNRGRGRFHHGRGFYRGGRGGNRGGYDGGDHAFDE